MTTRTTQMLSEDRLRILLLNRDYNEALLEQLPHRILGDMAQFYVLQEECSFHYVTNEQTEEAGYSEEDLHRIALREMPRHVSALLFPLSQILKEEQTLTEDLALYVLTNTDQLYGAASILYPGMLSYLRMRMQSDFYILPSSVHEMLLVPKQEPYTPDQLQNLLTEANRDIVKPEERLSKYLYQYNAEDGELQMLSPSDAVDRS